MGGAGTKKDAFQNWGNGANLSSQLAANASNIYGAMEPQLASEAAHPSGFTPGEKATMNTAAQQSAGGSNASAIGQGRLYAARTRNAGGAKAAIGSGVRSSGENLSHAAVGTELANAQLAHQNQQKAQAGLLGLNNTELTSGLGFLNSSNQALKETQYDPWLSILQQGMQSGGQVGSAALMA